jgi:hypothetical protein
VICECNLEVFSGEVENWLEFEWSLVEVGSHREVLNDKISLKL